MPSIAIPVQDESFHRIPGVLALAQVAPEDARFAEEVFAAHALVQKGTIALFAGGETAVQEYGGFGAALAAVCRERGLRVIALGSQRGLEINRRNLTYLGADGIDFTGKATFPQAVELVRRCRLAVGIECGLAHVAVDLGVPNVVLLGGGNFGRAMPRSPLTTSVALPLDCLGCGWNCRFVRPHCVRDVAAEVIAIAIRIALDTPVGTRPRIVLQDRSLWGGAPGLPGWSWFYGLLPRQSYDLISVGRRDADLVVTQVALPRRHLWGTPATEAHLQRIAVARDCLQAAPGQLPAVFASAARGLVRHPHTADLPATPDEWMFLDEIRSGLARGGNDPHALNYGAAAMLYFRPHELPPCDAKQVPPWLVEDFIAWSILAPGLFYDEGEKEKYIQRIETWLLFMRDQVMAAPDRTLRHRLAEAAVARLNLIPAYFAAQNLRQLCSVRGDIIAAGLADLPLDFAPPPRSGGRIRVGIVKNHWGPSTETYATLPLFEHLPRDRFEVVLYTLVMMGSPAEVHCQAKADRLVVLPSELMQQVDVIRRDRCDFIFYAMNMTAVTHPLVLLAMFRLAPVQATSICSPMTTGLPRMDVFIVGELSEKRPSAQDEYREKLVKLPGSGICFDYSLRPPPSEFAISRAHLNLSDATIVFTSGANFYKVIPELRRTWVRVLAATPGSVLVLYPFGPAWTDHYPSAAFLRCFHEELRAAGVENNRAIFLSAMPSTSDVGKVMSITDIYLDSFPYTGATSLLDPLEAGVPPVTMAGERLRFGQGEALLRELGMPELIATSEDHYLQLATELARDRGLLAARRTKVREKMGAGPPFLDSERFCARVATVIEELVEAASA